jgi:TonB family protein
MAVDEHLEIAPSVPRRRSGFVQYCVFFSEPTMKIKPRLLAVFVVSGLLALPAAGWTQSLSDQAKQLELQYKRKPIRMRYLLSDSKIRYDAAGNLKGKWNAGRWTWHSTVEVTKVEAKQNVLKITANRLMLNYNRSTHQFQPLRSGHLEIEIETSPKADGSIDVEKEWSKAFLNPTEEYPLEMQPYWKPFIACLVNPQTTECEYYERKSFGTDGYSTNPPSGWRPAYPDVYSVGRGVTAPTVRSRVEPQYTEVARLAHVTGTVALEAIVTKDGGVRIVRVIRPIGYGLEENAAEALSQWVFDPATRMGQPVDVRLEIEVGFNTR